MPDQDVNTQNTVLLWAWRYQALWVEEFDTLDAAIRAAAYGNDSGEMSVDCIEVWDTDGYRLIEGGEVLKQAWAFLEESDANAPPPKPTVATVHVKHPEKGETYFNNYLSLEKAEADLARLKPLLGDRVWLQRREK